MKNDKTKVLVSFCIPTYNRAEIVRCCVTRILEYKGNEIEVVVVDNDSPDSTEETLGSINDQRLAYYKNEINLGAAANIVETIKRANGSWVFTLSDEDIVTKETVFMLVNKLSIINPSNVSVILGNIRTEKGMYYSYFNGTSYVHYRYSNAEYEKGDEAISSLGFHHRYLSGILVAKRSIDKDDLLDYSVEQQGISPHMTIYTKACLKGNAITFDTDFLVKSDSAGMKSFIENISGKHYKHPNNRLRQFKFYLALANEIIEHSTTKIKVVKDLYGYYLNASTFEWENILKTSLRREYFGLSHKEESDFYVLLKWFKIASKGYLNEIIQDTFVREQLLGEFEKKTTDFKKLKITKDIKRILKPLKPILKPLYDFLRRRDFNK